ncbi:hypothetical protein QBC33DRAFT_513751 [Phialemonium atrogriseum]|uniref:Uncharacterized protein n=1 Tax=Phialemonium atrogriseum TaxID=1093897 RepID=A0AAJ0FIH4_9PEZI|nr:uncharacterized protein QBC33DRAFT_513751 [Phialemonium atrogriseum]KAK1768822.1 hypothetical protein QBC33DRAFT_513751 [Phialemonium atrogriseum]
MVNEARVLAAMLPGMTEREMARTARMFRNLGMVMERRLAEVRKEREAREATERRLAEVQKERETREAEAVALCCAIEEHGEQRLTCWYPNWEDHHQKHSNKFGQADDKASRTFVAVQGDPGTPVGLAARWMGETDIALAKLNDGVIFENNFKEMVFSAKTSIHSDDQWMADSFIIDSALACVYLLSQRLRWRYLSRVCKVSGEILRGIIRQY